MDDVVPAELAEGWEVYSAIQSGMVKPLTLEQWNGLPDPVVFQVMIIMEVVPQVAEAKSRTTTEK